ncbi:hypothetical protein RCM44_02470, partial [Escherichia coli]|nr:hypothetical protein [Escherichia coli]
MIFINFPVPAATITALFSITTEAITMTEAEMLRMIRRVAGIRPPAGKQEATQPDTVTAENYARVVAEVMRRDGIEL